MMSANRMLARRHSRGFSLVAAIFLLVILALLGAFMVTIGEAERWTTVEAAQGARAYQAAQAGLEWGIAQTVPIGGAFSCPAGPPASFAVGGFNVTVTRTPAAGNPYTEGATTVNVCAVASTAVAAGATLGNPDYFSRTLQATITDAPGP